jgi:phosphopantetheine--protein transferase-like protein
MIDPSAEPGVTPARSGETFVAGLLPDTATVVEGPMTTEIGALWPEEAASLIDAAPKRRREFAVGRWFARRALDLVGAPPGPLLAGPDRAPLWPAGITGSITHTNQYCAVAVARTTELAAIGIDVEDVTRFNLDVLRYVLTPRELAIVLAGDDAQRQRQGGAMFSVKEALYKCLSAIAPVELAFDDVAVELGCDGRRFEVELLKPAGRFAAGHRLVGRSAFAGNLVATAIVLPAHARAT